MMTIDADAAIDRFLQLAAIEGPSGREQAVMERLVAMLTEAGVDPGDFYFDDANTRSRLGGETGNLIVRLRGTIDGPTTMLSAHADTVPICVGSDPVVDGDEVRSRNTKTGLGADDRAGCAAIATAVIELLRSGVDYAPVTLLFCIQEEVGLFGARHLNRELLGKVDRAFNFDGGTVEKLTCGATGGERITIKIHGIPAHAGVSPQSGASAIVMAAQAISSLHQEGWLGRIDKPGIGTGTANVGVIEGGDATNVITPLVTLRAEARSHQEAMRRQIVAQIENAFRTAAKSVTNEDGKSGEIEFESRVDYESFALADDDPSVLAGEAAVRAVGREPYRNISDGGLDANWLFRHGLPAVTLGCGQRNIHTADERLCIADFLDSCRIALHLISSDNQAAT
ncbi:MAG: M20/M25/M40 family metallo-hydrolase [Planctomycetaceae bacterium]